MSTYSYTTRMAIASRLEGRLTVGGSSSPFGPAVVDDKLIDRMIEQVEARVNAVLSQRYRLPLVGDRLLVSSVVEKLVLCEIYTTYAIAEQQFTSSSQGVDRSPAGVFCRAGGNELEAIASGAVILPGEVLIGGQDSAVLPTNYSGARVRSDLGARDVRSIQF